MSNEVEVPYVVKNEMPIAVKDETPTAAKAEANGKHILSIDEMLSADQTEYLVLPGWKYKDPKTGELVQGYVRVRSLTAEQVAEWRETIEGPAKKTMGIRLFVDSLVDEDNKPIGNPTYYAAFKKANNAIQERIIDQLIELNALRTTKKDVADAKNG